MVTFVVSISVYYVHLQFEQRRERLTNLELYRISPEDKKTKKAAPIDPFVNGMLYPRPEVYLPLQQDLPIQEEWGPEIRHWKVRPTTTTRQVPPDRKGPP